MIDMIETPLKGPGSGRGLCTLCMGKKEYHGIDVNRALRFVNMKSIVYYHG